MTYIRTETALPKSPYLVSRSDLKMQTKIGFIEVALTVSPEAPMLQKLSSPWQMLGGIAFGG